MIRIWGAAKCSNRMVPSERPGAPRRRPGTPRHLQRDTQENAKGHPETHKAGQGATGDPQETLRDPHWSPGGAQESTRETIDIRKKRPETPNDTQKTRQGRPEAPKTCQRGAPETPVAPEAKTKKTLNAVKRLHQKRRRVRCRFNEEAPHLNLSTNKLSALWRNKRHLIKRSDLVESEPLFERPGKKRVRSCEKSDCL